MLDPQRRQRLVVGEILDDQHDIAQMRAKLGAAARQRRARDRLDRVGVGRRERLIGCGHAAMP